MYFVDFLSEFRLLVIFPVNFNLNYDLSNHRLKVEPTDYRSLSKTQRTPVINSDKIVGWSSNFVLLYFVS